MSAVEAPRPASLELGWHLRTAGRTLLFLLLGVPYGLAYLVLAPVGAAARRRLFWGLAEVERRQANRRLDAHLPPVPRLHDRAGFLRALALLLLKLPVTLAALALAAVPALLVVALVALGIEGLSGGGEGGRGGAGRVIPTGECTYEYGGVELRWLGLPGERVH